MRIGSRQTQLAAEYYPSNAKLPAEGRSAEAGTGTSCLQIQRINGFHSLKPPARKTVHQKTSQTQKNCPQGGSTQTDNDQPYCSHSLQQRNGREDFLPRSPVAQ